MTGEYLNRKESAVYLGLSYRHFPSMVDKGMVQSDKIDGYRRKYSLGLLDSVKLKFRDLIKKYRDGYSNRHETPRPKLDDNVTREQLHGDAPAYMVSLPSPAQPKSLVKQGKMCANCKYLHRIHGEIYPMCARFRLAIEKENLKKCGCGKFAPVKESGRK